MGFKTAIVSKYICSATALHLPGNFIESLKWSMFYSGNNDTEEYWQCASLYQQLHNKFYHTSRGRYGIFRKVGRGQLKVWIFYTLTFYSRKYHMVCGQNKFEQNAGQNCEDDKLHAIFGTESTKCQSCKTPNISY